jgi:arabinan endo-1,5-alpha-L-arabinosidase
MRGGRAQSESALKPGNFEVFPGDGAVAAGTAGVHDPTVIQFGRRYFLFQTSGNSFTIVRSSEDLKSWKEEGPVLAEQPPWLAARYRHRSIWAPDIVVIGKKLRMYYSASNWGTNDSVIGLAECENFDPKHPTAGWIDRGLVLESKRSETPYNAIDPEVAVTPDGEQWLAYGSYFGGIYIVQLDPATGKLKASVEDEAPRLIARNTIENGNPLEGAAILRRGDYFYLFVSYGLAAQGVRSTYRIMVGRSKAVAGPYLDATGKSMADGGYLNVLKGSPPMFSPGHCDALTLLDGRTVMPYHFYDGRHYWNQDKWGRPALQIRELLWSNDGWPLPGLPLEYEKPHPNEKVAGKWLHQVDFGEPSLIELMPDGRIAGPSGDGSWSLHGDHLTMKWPKKDAASEYWIDELTFFYGHTYYVGRNQGGLIIRGARQ